MVPNLEGPKPKYCIYCGAPLQEISTQCSQCGKDVTGSAKLLHEWKTRKEESNVKHTRICKNCNTIVESTILLQCPICGTPLPEIHPPENILGKYIFVSEKRQLVAAQELRLDPNIWKIREMGGVFLISLIMFVFIYLAVEFFLGFSSSPSITEPVEPTMILVLVGSAMGILIGVYPLIYVYTRNMNPEKKLALKVNPTGILLGLVFGIGLYFVLIASNILNGWIAVVTPIFQLPDTSIQEYNLIISAAIWEQILFGVLFIARNIFEEILFRGVLLKGLDDALPAKARVVKGIMLTALIYASIFAVLSLSLAFFITNFSLSLVLSVAFYLCKKSTTSTMIAQGVFSTIYFLAIMGLLPF